MRHMMGGMNSSTAQTAIGALTVSDGRSATKVIMTPGFWKKGTGSSAWYRTQMMLQGTIVQVTGTTRLGVNFSSVGYDSPGDMRLGAIASRRSTTLAGLYSASWTYGIAPTVDRPAWIQTGLAPATTYFIEWRTTHPCSDPVGQSAAFDTHEEPGDGNYSSHNNGFWNFTGFAHDLGATFSDVTLARTLKYALIHSDSNGEGRLNERLPGDGGTTTGTVSVMEHRSAILWTGSAFAPISEEPWDNRGALGQYQWLMLDSNGTTNSYHWAIIDQSYGGCFQGKMSAAWRNVLATFIWPGLWKDVVTRMKWRTNYDTTDFTSGSDWTGGITPNLVWFTSFYNDTIQQSSAANVPGGFGGPFDAGFGSTTPGAGEYNEKDNVGKSTGTPESLLHLAYTTWGADVAVFVTTHHSTDAVWGVDTKAQIAAATSTDTNYYNISGAGGTKFDANKGRFFDMFSAKATTGLDPTDTSVHGGLHFDYEKHVLLAGAMQSTLNALSV